MFKDVSIEFLREVERFYYREARLFSAKEYRQWLEEMVDKEIHYSLPIFEERRLSDQNPSSEFPVAIYDDDYADLDERIARLDTNLVWTEDPPTRIRHLITNIEAFETDSPEELEAYSNFLICRNRGERSQTIFAGGREDRLRRRDGTLRLLRRRISLPQRVVLDSNLYFFI